MIDQMRRLFRRRRTTDEGGFSLIELIVVIAIIGILIAVAIPVYGNIKETSQKNHAQDVAASGAKVVAAAIAANDPSNTPAQALADSEVTNQYEYTLTTTDDEPIDLNNFCVEVAGPVFDDVTAQSGPGC